MTADDGTTSTPGCGTTSDARKRLAEQTPPRYYIAADGFGDVTLWRHNPERPDSPQALSVFTEHEAGLWDFINAAINGELQ